MSWRKITFVVVILIVLLGGSYALSKLFISMKSDPPRRADMEARRSVKALPVVYNQVISPLEREGRVLSGNEVVLVAEISGKIIRGDVPVKKGALFKQGQLLAVIYKEEAELALKARKSRFLNGYVNMLPDIKIDFPEQYEAFLHFFKAVDLEKDLPKLPDIQTEKLKIFLASRDVLAEYYGIKQDEKRLGRHSLYAPFAGTFTQVNFEPGAYVNAGGQIAQMIRTDALEIEVPVENVHSHWIRLGDKVTVHANGAQKLLRGTVMRKAGFVSPDTQSRSIFVKLDPSAENAVVTGEYLKVEFPGQPVEGAMEILRTAVFNSNEVFTVVEGRLKKAPINILKVNQTTLLFNGIEEGTKLVVEPLINAKDNMPVDIFGETPSGGENGRPGGKPAQNMEGQQ